MKKTAQQYRLQMAAVALSLTGALALCASSAQAQEINSMNQPSTAPITHAQVKSDLKAVENAGYHPNSGQDPTYPKQAQAAERRVSAGEGPRYRVAQTGAQAQSQAPVTAASRQAEVSRLEAVGYNPANGNKTTYPQDLQNAEKKAGMN